MAQQTGFLFDMDGTLLNNMQYHLQAWEKAVGEAGSDLKGEDLFKELYGKNKEVLERVFKKDKKSPEELEEIGDKKDGYYREFYKPHIALIPGAKEFLTAAAEKGISLAVATSGVQANVDFDVDELHIRSLFTTFISDEDVENSKPDPETFIVAAKKLGVPPARCIVFEDVPKGVEAAQKAGMKAVVILTSHTPEDFTSFNNIIRCVPDYKSLDVQELVSHLDDK